MHQHVKVLQFGENNNTKANGNNNNNDNCPISNGFPQKKSLPYQYKNQKTKETSSRSSYNNNDQYLLNKQQQPQPRLPKKKLIIQDSYENIDSMKDPKKALKSQVNNSNKNEGFEDPKLVNTINLIANNPKQYKYTNKMLRAIGEITSKSNVGFLVQKEENNNEPSAQLSHYLGEKLKVEDRAKVMAAENLNQDEEQGTDEDHYYNNLVSYIKSEMKKKGKFDFTKLSEKDRKLLAQRKLYDRMGEGNKGNTGVGEVGNIMKNKKEEFEFKKEYFAKENIPYENYSDGEGKNEEEEKEEKEEEEEEEEEEEKGKQSDVGKNKKEISNEKPTARQILENVLSKIEYSNQMFVNNIEAKQKKKAIKTNYGKSKK